MSVLYNNKCCNSCGAPLNLKLEKCEYCHTLITTNKTQFEYGWADPRSIYGMPDDEDDWEEAIEDLETFSEQWRKDHPLPKWVTSTCPYSLPKRLGFWDWLFGA